MKLREICNGEIIGVEDAKSRAKQILALFSEPVFAAVLVLPDDVSGVIMEFDDFCSYLHSLYDEELEMFSSKSFYIEELFENHGE